MASALSEAQKLLPQFKAAVQGKDVPKANSLLIQLKIAMTNFPSQESAQGSSASTEEISICRDILETAIQLAIQTNDGPGLERNYQQLRPYYSSSTLLHETSQQKTQRQHSLGLYLMYLLIETNLSAFHTLIERLSEEDRTSNYIYFPLKLEMLLQEGSYNKILATRNSDTIPSPYYKPFFDRLTSTIRDDIAECASSAYTTLSVPAAIKMMMFDNVNGLNAYITEKNLPWIIENSTIQLKTIEKTKPEIDALQLMKNTTQYASELEKIV